MGRGVLLSIKGRGEGCCMRNDKEETVRRAEGEAGVMNWWLGSVKVPLWRAEMVT